MGSVAVAFGTPETARRRRALPQTQMLDSAFERKRGLLCPFPLSAPVARHYVVRARTQFKLVDSITRHEEQMQAFVDAL